MLTNADIVVSKIRKNGIVSGPNCLPLEGAMKKLRSFTAIIIAVLAIFVVAAFACACSGDGGQNKQNTEYTITLMVNEDDIHDSYTGVKGSTVTFGSEEDPYMSGYTFVGWSVKPDGDVVELPTVMPEGNVTYYAVFVKYYTIELKAGEGTLSSDVKAEAKAGDLLYNAVKDIVPTAPQKAVFDGWYYNNNKLTADSTDKMIGGKVTLVAKYSINYTINIFLQSEFKSENYSEVAADKITGTGLLGSNPRDLENKSYAGKEFDVSKSTGAIDDFVLKADGNNVFNAYYSVLGYTVQFSGNVPANETVGGTMENAEWGYDVETTVPACGYTRDGYRFSYWSTDPAGTDKFAEKLYAGHSKHSVTENTILYAIWVKGYTDASYSSDDVVFVDRTNVDAPAAYLKRLAIDGELTGSFDESTQIFKFKIAQNSELSGRVFKTSDEDGREVYSFTYFGIDSDGFTTYKLRYADVDKSVSPYKFITSENVAETLKLKNDGATAKYYDGNNEYVGKYEFDMADNALKFTSDDKNEDDGNPVKSFNYRVTTAINATTGVSYNVFEKRGAEYGIRYRLDSTDGIKDMFRVFFDGYGNATMLARGVEMTSAQAALQYSQTVYTYGSYRVLSDANAEHIELLARLKSTTEKKNGEIYQLFCKLVDNYPAKDAQGKDIEVNVYAELTDILDKVYVEDASADTDDRFELDGYGYSVFKDNATRYVNGEPHKGNYVYDKNIGAIIFTDATTKAVTYVEVHENEVAATKDVIKNIYKTVPKVWGRYTVTGAGVTMKVYDDASAEILLFIPVSNFWFGNTYWDNFVIISGNITQFNDAVEDGAKEYLFVADPEEYDEAELEELESFYSLIFQVTLNLTRLKQFTFGTVAQDDKIIAPKTGSVKFIAQYDGCKDVKFKYTDKNGVSVGYTANGYGKAKSSDNKEITYTVSSIDDVKVLIYKHREDNVDKQEFFFRLDYPGQNDVAYQRTAVYTITNVAEGVVTLLVLGDGDKAVLAYSTDAGSHIFSYGTIAWSGDKTLGKYTSADVFDNVPYAVYLLDSIGYSADGETYSVDFGIYTKQITDSSGKPAEQKVAFVYRPATLTDNKYVIKNVDNSASLTIDLATAVALYKEGDAEVASGEFVLRDNFVTIVDEARQSTLKLMLTLSGGNVTQILKLGEVLNGIWHSYDYDENPVGHDGYLELSGSLVANKSDEYVGKFHKATGYNADGEVTEYEVHNGTYKVTNPDADPDARKKYVFTCTETGHTDSFAFVTDSVNAFMPVYEVYKTPVISEDDFDDKAMIKDGIYIRNTSGGAVYFLVQGDGYSRVYVLWASGSANCEIKKYDLKVAYGDKQHDLYSFEYTTSGSNTVNTVKRYFVISEKVGILLDALIDETKLVNGYEIAGYNRFIVSDTETISVTKAVFNGLGEVTLYAGDKSYKYYYVADSTTGSYVIAKKNDENKLVRVGSFRIVNGVISFENINTGVYSGANTTAFVLNGYDIAVYVDEYGKRYRGNFEVVVGHDNVICLTYVDGVDEYKLYFEISINSETKARTFVKLDYTDQRIPAQESTV